MRTLWIAFIGLTLLLPVACDSGDDVPGRQVPRTVPPASISTPLVIPERLPTKPVEGSGPIFEAAVTVSRG